jgi:DDE domain
VEHQGKVFMGCDYNIDETYIKVKGQWRYLYRAVDKQGQTIDFLLTEHRDKEAALRFLKKAIRRHGVPEQITIDGSDANEGAIKSYNEEHGTSMIIRQVKYLNNMVEQDHRSIKRVTRPMLGFKSFEAAQDTLVGIELLHMIKKRQLVVAEGDEAALRPNCSTPWPLNPSHSQGQLPFHDLLSKIWVVYLSPADKYHRLTHRLSQEQRGLEERALRASQRPFHPW